MPKRSAPTVATKELHLTMTLRNNRLRALRVAAGLTNRELSQKARVGAAAYGRLERLKLSPQNRKGGWRKIAIRLAKYWHLDEETLFPIVTQQVEKPEVTREISATDVGLLIGEGSQYLSLPLDDQVRDSQRAEQVADALKAVSNREEHVLRMLYGIGQGQKELNTTEAAEELGVTKSRVMQIRDTALKKLQKRKAKLQELL